jgi:DNA repair protein RadA/Sms
MTERGLAEVDRLGSCMSASAPPRPGAAVFPLVHGTRASLVEIQALTASGILGAARRKTSGLDPSRLAVLIAVLEKHGGLRLADQDVFAAAVGGWRVAEPAADLAICLAIAGAHLRRALPGAACVVGEVGLDGDVRAVGHLEARAREAVRLGYRTLLGPQGQHPGRSGASLRPVGSIAEVLTLLAPVAPPAAGSRRAARMCSDPEGSSGIARPS